MYRVVVISAPEGANVKRGSTYALRNGVLRIGRTEDNDVPLSSQRVSKSHCHLKLVEGRLEVSDSGSSNGTFVNGKLVAKREIRAGDKIGVGDFLLEVSQMDSPSNVIILPSALRRDPAPSVQDKMPDDLMGKIKYINNNYIIPYTYQINDRYPWKTIFVGVVIVFCIANLFLTVTPILEQQDVVVTQEVVRRAQSMAIQLADRNTEFVAGNQMTKLALGQADRMDGVRLAVITDLDQKILAPATQAGQYLAEGIEAKFMAAARADYAKGLERGIATHVQRQIALAIEPIKQFNNLNGKNEIVALVLVSMNTAVARADFSQQMMAYSYTLVWSFAIGLILFYFLYLITLRPIVEMNRKIDSILRGEAIQFDMEAKFEEFEELWQIVDSALKRIPKTSMESAGSSSMSLESAVDTVRSIVNLSKDAMAALDGEKKIAVLNSTFEEWTGIRSDSSIGQTISQAARDQSLAAMMQDMLGRAQVGSSAVVEESDISGNPCSISVSAFGSGANVTAYLVQIVRKADE